MNKVIIFGSALLCSTIAANASWVAGQNGMGDGKSMATLASLVEQRTVSLGSVKATSELKTASLPALASSSVGAPSAKVMSARWKDAVSVGGLGEVTTEFVLAKNDLGPLPEAGTWAGAGVAALAAAYVWRFRRVQR